MNHFARAFQNLVLICLALLASFLPERLDGADLYTQAAHELAGKIMKAIGPLAEVEFSFQSRTSLEIKEVAAARQAIETELSAQGLKLVKESQFPERLKVTLAESYQQYLWIAEIRNDPGYQVVMATQARVSETPADVTLRMTIQSRQIYEQTDPILDIKLLGDEMLVLDPKRLALFLSGNDEWKFVNGVAIKSPHSFPRDVRGRLEDDGNVVQAHLPGLSCNGTIGPEFTLNCSQDETSWPLDLGSITPAFSKNYFVQKNLPAFFSAARVEDDGTDLLVLTGTDGRTYLFDEAADQAGKFDNWGSDIAAVDSECGARRQILASLPTDPLEHGAIQAFEIAHRKAVATSSTVEFPGPITALWPVANQNAAIAVSRSIKTGLYAAFYLSIACSR